MPRNLQSRALFTNFCCNHGLEAISSSPLIRSDQHLFTFSPILDLEQYYQQQNITSYPNGVYKIQQCFRQVFPQNLFNPLALPLQVLYSINIFQRQSSLKLIASFIDEYLINMLGLQQEKIYVISPDNAVAQLVQQSLTLAKEHLLLYAPQRLRINIPTIAGEHFYIKIGYRYHDGFVTVANFAVIDYRDGSFMLDAAIFEERLEMLTQGKEYLFTTQQYLHAYQQLHNCCNQDKQVTHALISNFLAFATIFSELKEISNKKHGYIAKKLLNDIFNLCYYYEIAVDHDLLKALTPVACDCKQAHRGTTPCASNQHLVNATSHKPEVKPDVAATASATSTERNQSIISLIVEQHNKFQNNIKSNLKNAQRLVNAKGATLETLQDLNATYGISKFVALRLFATIFKDPIFSIASDNKNNFAYQFDLASNDYFKAN